MNAKLYTLKDIVSLTGYNRSTIYRKIKSGEFPAPRKIGASSRWPIEDYMAWRDMVINHDVSNVVSNKSRKAA